MAENLIILEGQQRRGCDIEDFLDERSAVLDIEGHALAVTYRPADFSWKDTLAAQRGEYGLEDILPSMARFLVSWDLTRRGEPVGTDAASLEALPGRLLMAIFAAITEDLKGDAGGTGNPPTSTSPATSAPRARSGRARRTTR